MERIEKSIEVHVPVRVAYNQWTQFEEFPKFMEGIREVRQLDDKHMHWVAEIGGKHKEWDAEIDEQIPDQRIAWHSMGGTHNDGIVEFKPMSQDDTCVTVRMEYDPEGLVETVGDFFGLTSHRVEKDLERFKTFIESRGHETGAWRGRIEDDEASPTMAARGMDLESSTEQRPLEGQEAPPPKVTRGEAAVDPYSATPSDINIDFLADYDRRYAATGIRYEEYEVAYRYGYGLGDQHAGREWADVERDAQRDWEMNRPGTWGRFKEAIRTGWEKTKRAVSKE